MLAIGPSARINLALIYCHIAFKLHEAFVSRSKVAPCMLAFNCVNVPYYVLT